MIYVVYISFQIINTNLMWSKQSLHTEVMRVRLHLAWRPGLAQAGDFNWSRAARHGGCLSAVRGEQSSGEDVGDSAPTSYQPS